jgi:hypothetical protein
LTHELLLIVAGLLNSLQTARTFANG